MAITDGWTEQDLNEMKTMIDIAKNAIAVLEEKINGGTKNEKRID